MKLKEQQIEDLRREVSTLQQQALLVQQGQKEGQIDTTSEPQSSNRISAESTSQSQPYYAPSVQYTPPNSMLAPRLVVPSTTKLPMDHQLNRQEEGVRTLFKPSDHEKSALTQSSEASDKICCICYQESSGLTVSWLY